MLFRSEESRRRRGEQDEEKREERREKSRRRRAGGDGPTAAQGDGPKAAQVDGCRLSPAESGSPRGSSHQRSQTGGPACPRQQGSPPPRAVLQGSGCATCHQKWAAGHMGQDGPGEELCLSSLEG